MKIIKYSIFVKVIFGMKSDGRKTLREYRGSEIRIQAWRSAGLAHGDKGQWWQDQRFKQETQ